MIASNLIVTNNQAIGGAEDTGVLAGLGNGGGIEDWYGGTFTISNSTIAHNQAIGGQLVGGSPLLQRGNGFGGGLSNIQGASFTLIDSVVSHNRARGGEGVDGPKGGNGLGGGIYSDGSTAFGVGSLSITDTKITHNRAIGGEGQGGFGNGEGDGGGLYLADGGIACLDMFTQKHTTKNHASTGEDDIVGSFTTC